MAVRVNGPLKIIAFNANGIRRWRYEFSKQLQNLRIDVALRSEAYLKPHERFLIPNHHLSDCPLPGKTGIPITV
jgi:hypothetical protein